MHSIKDFVEKIKGFRPFQAHHLRTLPDDLFLGLIIVLVALGSFGLGRLSKIEGSKTPIQFENLPENSTKAFENKDIPATREVLPTNTLNATNSQIVGSKTGKKYYYPWCTGVQKISPSSLIHFSSKSEAESRGYTPSATCKGL